MTPMFEGVGIALESLRTSKARAALTILGIAIGVMVVMLMAAMISGINKSVSNVFESIAPRTFLVWRFFQAGVNVSDGSDENSPWRRNPPINEMEADRVRAPVSGAARRFGTQAHRGDRDADLESDQMPALVEAGVAPRRIGLHRLPPGAHGRTRVRKAVVEHSDALRRRLHGQPGQQLLRAQHRAVVDGTRETLACQADDSSSSGGWLRSHSIVRRSASSASTVSA